MTRYRMPEVLGGGELVGRCVRDDGLIGIILEGEWFWMPKALLTEVKPPLPEEPPDGSAIAVGSSVFQRLDAEAEPGDDHRWFAAGRQFMQFGSRWAALCDGPEPPVLLVPDPFAEPVALPWELPVYGATLVVEVNPAKFVGLRFDVDCPPPYAVADHLLIPSTARNAARALWAAADAVEKEAP